MNVVAFLQNAWHPTKAGGEWSRDSWLMALERSVSGHKLARLGLPFAVYENASPIITATPRGKPAADDDHIRAILERRQPNLVVALGLVAELALVRLWDGPLLALPHPASRVLTHALYQEAADWLLGDGTCVLTGPAPVPRVALRQRRGRTEWETLNTERE